MQVACYEPSTAYWKEVRELDKRLYDGGFRERTGRLALSSEVTRYWSGSEAEQVICWFQRRTLGLIPCKSELIVIDNASQTANPGVLQPLTDYRYVAAGPHRYQMERLINFHSCGATLETEAGRAARDATVDSILEQRRLGLSIPEEADYEYVLNELQRGVSGHYTLFEDEGC